MTGQCRQCHRWFGLVAWVVRDHNVSGVRRVRCIGSRQDPEDIR